MKAKINIKLKIGEFSKLCQVSVKTLRYYEELQLLVPLEVDEWTGYRYYQVSQMQQMNEIQHLKRLGFNLNEIHEMFSEGITTPTTSMLEQKIRECDDSIAQLSHRKMELLSLNFRHKNHMDMENINIRRLPAIIVASHRQVINSYNDLFTLCPDVIGPEMQRLGCECSDAGYCFTVDHNEEYSTTNIDIEYCEQVKERKADSELIQFKDIAEVPQALCYQHYGSYDKLPESWTKIMAYMEEMNYHIADNPRFVYIDGIWNKEREEDWLTEIQIPIECTCK